MNLLEKQHIKVNGLLGDATDYSICDITIKKLIVWFLMGFVISGIVIYIFYENIILSVVLGAIGGLAFIPIRKKQVIKKRKKNLLSQFKDMLDAVSTSIGAGKNIYDSFIAAKSDLLIQYSPEADIVSEVDFIVHGINNNIQVEDLLMNFAERSQLDDVRNFAGVFSTCYEKGGNIKDVIRSTTTVISDKIDVQMELETMVAGQKNEQNIMMVMPVVFVLLMKFMGGGLIDLSSVMGIVSVTISIVIFIIAYFISKKILDIKL
ncbi:MAG TPA: hypothetical protein GX401_03420 [Clostridiales bacterium]|nr:hypothetical protein [Clostridiales bacterium]